MSDATAWRFGPALFGFVITLSVALFTDGVGWRTLMAAWLFAAVVFLAAGKLTRKSDEGSADE